LENWTWGLSLIALTIAMHGAGVILMALRGLSIRARIESRHHLTLRHVAAIHIGAIGTVGLLLAALHGVEAALWAAAYS
jgi:predicted metal-dependent HD superfamily phosphohydrolase